MPAIVSHAQRSLEEGSPALYDFFVFPAKASARFTRMSKENSFEKVSSAILGLLALFMAPVASQAEGTPEALAKPHDFVDLVTYCDSCHGTDGISVIPFVPIIAGFSEEGFLNTIDAYRDGERVADEYHNPGEPETVMNDIAKALTDEEVSALAKYYSERKFKPAYQPADPEKARRGAILHKQSCERCHPENGAKAVADSTILAGQWMPYLRRQFDNILSKKRWVPRSMYRRVKKLSPQDIDDLLHFYALEGDKIHGAPSESGEL